MNSRTTSCAPASTIGVRCAAAAAFRRVRTCRHATWQILRNIVLVRIIDGGRDYEFRIVGDAHVQGYGIDFNRMRNSDIERIAPQHGTLMRVLYEHVRNTGEPLAFRGWVGREVKDALFVYHESAFLPLGEQADAVDHILVVSIYVPKAQA